MSGNSEISTKIEEVYLVKISPDRFTYWIYTEDRLIEVCMIGSFNKRPKVRRVYHFCIFLEHEYCMTSGSQITVRDYHWKLMDEIVRENKFNLKLTEPDFWSAWKKKRGLP